VDEFSNALYRHADTHGYDRDGFIVDEVLLDGTCYRRSRRTWPITEAIKANVIEAEIGRREAFGKVINLASLLRRHFLNACYGGGWMDRFDESGQPASDFMPASTFYHVISAVDELERLRRRQQFEREVS
jgi:mannose-6-phosphate isomerase